MERGSVVARGAVQVVQDGLRDLLVISMVIYNNYGGVHMLCGGNVGFYLVVT